MKRLSTQADAVIIAAIAILILAIYYFFGTPSANRYAGGITFSMPTPLRDSLLAGMDIDSKINQLLVECGTASANTFGGIATTASNKQSANMGQFPQQAFDIWNTNTGALNLQADSLAFPPQNLVSRVHDSVLVSRYHQHSIRCAAIAGCSLIFLPLLSPDTNREAAYSQTVQQQQWCSRNGLYSVADAMLLHDYLTPDSVVLAPARIRSAQSDSISFVYFDRSSFASDSVAAVYIGRFVAESKAIVLYNRPDTAAIAPSDLLQLWQAGVNLFVLNNSNQQFHKVLKSLVMSNKISLADIDQRLIHALEVKYTLQNTATVQKPQATRRDTVQNLVLKHRLYERIPQLYHNKNTLPLRNVLPDSYQIVYFGQKTNDFARALTHYIEPASSVYCQTLNDLHKQLSTKTAYTSIVSLNAPLVSPDSLATVLKGIAATGNQVVVVDFAGTLPTTSTPLPLLNVGGQLPVFQDIAAQILFGGLAAYQHPNTKKDAQGYTPKTRLAYTRPEEAGLCPETLRRIDSIVANAIAHGAMPGCQVFVARHGRVVVNKAYGHFAYDRQQAVATNTLFDIASVTKVAATTMAVAKAYDKRQISLADPIGKCFDDLRIEYTRFAPDTVVQVDTLNRYRIKNIEKIVAEADTVNLNDTFFVATTTKIYQFKPENNIFKVNFRDLLLHQSGVMPSQPILDMYLYKARAPKRMPTTELNRLIDSLDHTTLETRSKTPKKTAREMAFDRYYSRTRTDSSWWQITDSMFLRKAYADTLWMNMKQLGVHATKSYQYSDVSMILLQQAMDSLNNQSIDTFMTENFYEPLGMRSTAYLPLRYFPRNRIAPTSTDRVWRSTLLQGYVHDPSAAFLGGLSGNAGLFSSANDLGMLFQMMLNGGTYGGERYLSENTVKLFGRVQEGSSRALGFDTPYASSIIADSASNNSYGHTGFTGCCVWVDPDNDLVYVFLSNRVHPDAQNWTLNKYKVRQAIHQTVYDAIKVFDSELEYR